MKQREHIRQQRQQSPYSKLPLCIQRQTAEEKEECCLQGSISRWGNRLLWYHTRMSSEDLMKCSLCPTTLFGNLGENTQQQTLSGFSCQAVLGMAVVALTNCIQFSSEISAACYSISIALVYYREYLFISFWKYTRAFLRDNVKRKEVKVYMSQRSSDPRAMQIRKDENTLLRQPKKVQIAMNWWKSPLYFWTLSVAKLLLPAISFSALRKSQLCSKWLLPSADPCFGSASMKQLNINQASKVKRKTALS